MKHAFIVGERVYLRALLREDLSGDYFDWLNDFEVTKYLETGTFPNTMPGMESYFESKQGSTSDVMLMIIERDSDRPIGTVKLGFINWIHQTAEFGIMIGAKQSWGKGYGTEVAELMLGYGFRRLNLHKINLGVAAVHAGAIRSYEKVGFKTEARVRQAAFIDGEYVDKVLMGITQEEYLAKCRES